MVATGGWWEKENLDTVVRIAEELTENMSVEFAGSILRPHAFLMKRKGELTKEGTAIIEEVKKSGRDFTKTGQLNGSALESIMRPLISREELLQIVSKTVESS